MVLFLNCRPLRCTTFLQTLSRFHVMLRMECKLLNTTYRALHTLPASSSLSPHHTPVPCEPATLNHFQIPNTLQCLSLTSGLCMCCSLCPEQPTLPLNCITNTYMFCSPPLPSKSGLGSLGGILMALCSAPISREGLGVVS